MPNLLLIPNVLAPDTQHTHLPTLVQDVVKETQVFFVEELRTARRFISSLKLGLTIEDLHFEQLNKNTSYEEVKRLFAKYKNQDIGIISEAGCPCIADPGSLASLAAHELGYKVVALPGPSSIFMALMASGFNGQQFTFHGYLNVKKDQKLKDLKRLQTLAEHGTQIFMETPYRNNAMLEDLIKTLAPSMYLSIAVDITSKNELVITKSISEWKKLGSLPGIHKRPTIFLLKSNPKLLSSRSK